MDMGTGGFGGGVKSTGGPMDTRVGWRHDNELGFRPEIDGPVRVAPELQDAWHVYYGNAGADRTGRDLSAAQADAFAHKQQQQWDRQADAAVPRAWSAERLHVRRSGLRRQRPQLQPFSPFA
jgi:hypothetical protein